METTPINLSLIGEQLGRFLKRLEEPGGAHLFSEFVELLNDEPRHDHPPIPIAIPQVVRIGHEFPLVIDDLRKSKLIRKIGGVVKIDDWAKALMESDSFAITPAKKQTQLIAISIVELGFTSKSSLHAVFEKIKQNPFPFIKELSNEAALYFALSQSENFKARDCFMAFKPQPMPKYKDTRPHILRLGSGKLSAIRIDTDRYIFPEDRLIFEKIA